MISNKKVDIQKSLELLNKEQKWKKWILIYKNITTKIILIIIFNIKRIFMMIKTIYSFWQLNPKF
jgi:hypothetical protein